MTNSLGTFFWLSFIFMFAKTKMEFPIYANIAFVGIVMVFMYFINIAMLQEHCGNVTTSTILLVTVLPWVLIFGNMMYILSKFPTWKIPFSNTFGLLFAKFAGCNTAFLDILKPQEKVEGKSFHYVYSDPSLIINQFTMENFDEMIQKLNYIVDITATDKINVFKQFVKLKEIISEWIWYLLTASITISVSYNHLISSKCTKTAEQYTKTHNNLVANATVPKINPAVYTVTL
jgi:hypothetical protein